MELVALLRAVDRHVRLHPHVHARRGADRRGHVLAAGHAHDLPRQRHRAPADGAERARGHEVRHPVPGVRAGVVRRPRLQRAGAVAGAGGVRLVRHPDVAGRRRAVPTGARGLAVARRAGPGGAGAGHHGGGAGLLPALLAVERLVHRAWHGVHQVAGVPGRAVPHPRGTGPSGMGLRGRGRVRSRSSRSRRSSPRPRSSCRSSSPRSRRWWATGPRCP